MRKKIYKTTMWLPAGAKEYWSTIMYGEVNFPYEIYAGDIIVAAYARFRDGTQVIGGVKKADTEDFNIKFFTVLNAAGQAYPGWPIDCSDHEDFYADGSVFYLNNDESVEYELFVKEREEES